MADLLGRYSKYLQILLAGEFELAFRSRCKVKQITGVSDAVCENLFTANLKKRGGKKGKIK